MEQYMGIIIVWGMLVDWWQFCLYWFNMDVIMIVNWYFIGKMVDCRNSVFIVKGLDVIVSYDYIFSMYDFFLFGGQERVMWILDCGLI